jgi:UDP-N-acetylmuramoyl-tripeptide--D-alanyl-D-alanine ligase
LQDGCARFRLVAADQSADVRLRLVGIHHVSNCLAAAAVAIDAGMAVPQVASLLSSAVARSRWRMETTRRADGVTVINDTYNANPESMRAAIDALVAVAEGRPTWAVLGQMAELGSHADAEHESLGRFAAARGVDHVVVVGPQAEHIVAGAKAEPEWSGRMHAVPDADSALALLEQQLHSGDVVLVKASRAAGLERLALALTDGVAE